MLTLNGVDERVFVKALEVWCGKGGCHELGMGEVQQLASVADQFQMTEVVSAAEETLLQHLRVDMCG